MNVQLIYIFECADDFKFVRETPSEILDIMASNYQELQGMKNNEDDFVNCFLDSTNKYFPKGSITAKLDGVYKFYELRTEIKEL